MSRFAAIGLTCLLLAASFGASACHIVRPNSKPLDRYPTIFLGRITGIHLQGYENHLLGKPDALLHGRPLTLTDGSSPVSVTVVPTNVVRGTATGSLELTLVGCTNALPALKERGIFFVNPGAASAVTVWESEPDVFSAWLARLGIAQDGR